LTINSIDGPAALRSALESIAGNLSFSWIPGARALFADLDFERFAALNHSPSGLLAELDDDALARALTPAYAERVRQVLAAAAAELDGPTWWEHRGEHDGFCVAYFSCEFGLDESLLIYSGGLGVLSGDHLKSAHELGVPLVAVGLLYREGYFRQSLDAKGRQVEHYPVNDFSRLPVTLVEGVVPAVELAGPEGKLVAVSAQVWSVKVGRISLYLLDTDVAANPEWARPITDTLYGGDREHRIHQELVLGIGGVRALRSLGVEPTVFHLNEGHSAFLQLERLRELVVEQGIGRDAALQRIRASTVFTTHTPVPAGNEIFDPALVRRNVGALAEQCGFEWPELAALGRVEPDDDGFGLTPFALHTAAYANAVSELHGEVSREMWRGLWPKLNVDDVPIGSITNGVHARTWISDALASALGVDADGAIDFARVHDIGDEHLWDLHRAAKHDLLAFIGRSRKCGELLDRDALTIGFARRFATYKRADLLFSDPDRLSVLLNDAERPLQLLLAGKAHPQDEGGKQLIQRVFEFSQDARSHGRVIFLEDYEMTLASYLVEGVDVWLNTPRRPLEASGTSGMKAALNGVLNCSILDGWWVEGYSPETGFAIGDERVAATDEEQDMADREALFTVLETQVLPTYYERDDRGVPPLWLDLMRHSIADLGARFNTNRMVAEYVDELYLPAHRDLIDQLAAA
jgi:starch phosphorylase